MTARIDGVGNVVGRYATADPSAKALIVGSHYDTVLNAGNYDGRLGILTGLVAVEQLNRSGRRLPFHLDLIGFAEEEGVRFSSPYLGSGAIAGRFDRSVLQRRDATGQSVADLIHKTGFDPEALASLARRPEDMLGYLEVHIEQGPVLLQQDLPVGIVTSIAGTIRYSVTITGSSWPCRHGADAAAPRCRRRGGRDRALCREALLDRPDAGRHRRPSLRPEWRDQRHPRPLRTVARHPRRRRRHA